jgi:hypothetical protein
MPRPRVPLERARTTGSAKKDPGRFAARSEPSTGPSGLGDAPAWLSPSEVVAWEQLRAEVPWLQASDRTLVALAAGILARVQAGEDVGPTDRNQLRLCLGQMGATPADRTRVNTAAESAVDPLDHYFS